MRFLMRIHILRHIDREFLRRSKRNPGREPVFLVIISGRILDSEIQLDFCFSFSVGLRINRTRVESCVESVDASSRVVSYFFSLM